MLNGNVKKKIKRLIEKVEEKEIPSEKEEKKKEPCTYIQQIKTFHNNTAWIGIPKKNILIPFGLKKGDWVMVTLKKMDLKDLKSD